MRKFETGATRNSDENKYDYEAFLSPAVIQRFGEYMHLHRYQADGTIRAGDNWQKGMSREAYMKSLLRHTIDFWSLHRGNNAINHDTGEPSNKEELLCAIMFNAMGYLFEELKNERD